MEERFDDIRAENPSLYEALAKDDPSLIRSYESDDSDAEKSPKRKSHLRHSA